MNEKRRSFVKREKQNKKRRSNVKSQKTKQNKKRRSDVKRELKKKETKNKNQNSQLFFIIIIEINRIINIY